MGLGDTAPARRTSIRVVPQEQDDDDRIEDPTKIDEDDEDYHSDPSASSQPRTKIGSFQFDFASSPALGESALSPPQSTQSRFECQPHARSSSTAVPWYEPLQSHAVRPDTITSAQGLSPPKINQSRFSQNTSSLSNASNTPLSPTANRPAFSPTTIVEDGAEEQPPTGRHPTKTHPLLSFTSAPNLDSSPPPIPLRGDTALSSPRSPPNPSAWRAFFAGPLPPPGASRFSASTTTPPTGPEYSPSTPTPPGSSDSSSSSFDGSSLSPLRALPAFVTPPPPGRIQSYSSHRYSHPFPTTYLEAIEEDEDYPSSDLLPPPIPRRSSDRPRTRHGRRESSDERSSSSEFADTPAGALAALSAAAGALTATSRRSFQLCPPPNVASSWRIQRLSGPPQLPPLPLFDHNTSSLQRLFSYYPSPKLDTETPHLPQQPFPVDTTPWSPISSLMNFESVRGPRGERFSSLREKRHSRGIYWADDTPRRAHRRCGIKGMSWKLWAIVLLILALVFGTIAIGLVVGLQQADKNDDNAAVQTTGAGMQPNANGTDQPIFPAGTFRIVTNLRNITTSCSNISATWNCAPGAAQTYWEGGINSSAITVLWTIIQNNLTEGSENDGFSISSGDDPFALQFSRAPLTLQDLGDQNEHWGFDTRVRKRVRPWVDVSGRNAAVECEYDNVQLSAQLFTKRQADGGFGAATDAWPGAVEVEERSGIEGSCAEVRNGVLGQRIAVGTGTGGCLCGYSNIDPGGD